ncbi:MAG TPA: hypothetical protein VN253_25090 [Kofleriaceae bacterium]|nr:hypothetical protein [Kofleriaceae bacterium]
MRWATLAIVTWLAGCNDLRDFRGAWQGARVGDAPVLRVGGGERASLTIDEIDAHHLAGRLAIEGIVPEQSFESLPGADADAVANLTFAGDPLRVYLAFVPVPDGGGDALALIALYDDRRVEVRALRGGGSPMYAIFALTSSPAS